MCSGRERGRGGHDSNHYHAVSSYNYAGGLKTVPVFTVYNYACICVQCLLEGA